MDHPRVSRRRVLGALMGSAVTAGLAGCGPRGMLQYADPGSTAATHDILVATTRTPQGDGFSMRRSMQTHFAAYRMGVPPAHQPGQIEWPEGEADPAVDFFVAGHAALSGPTDFARQIGQALAGTPRGGREAVIYVHGYNTNFAEALYRFTQIRHDFEFGGLSVLYSWPSAADPRSYLYDRDSVLFARGGLVELIDLLQASPVERIVLLGHSVGSQLVVEALRERALVRGRMWSKLDGVVLLSPDIDIDLFQRQATDIGTLPQPFVVVASSRDRVLQVSEWLSGSTARLGAVENLDVLNELGVTVFDTTLADPGRGADRHNLVTSPVLISLLAGLAEDRRIATGRPPDLLDLLPVRLVADGQAVGLVFGVLQR